MKAQCFRISRFGSNPVPLKYCLDRTSAVDFARAASEKEEVKKTIVEHVVFDNECGNKALVNILNGDKPASVTFVGKYRRGKRVD